MSSALLRMRLLLPALWLVALSAAVYGMETAPIPIESVAEQLIFPAFDGEHPAELPVEAEVVITNPLGAPAKTGLFSKTAPPSSLIARFSIEKAAVTSWRSDEKMWLKVVLQSTPPPKDPRKKKKKVADDDDDDDDDEDYFRFFTPVDYLELHVPNDALQPCYLAHLNADARVRGNVLMKLFHTYIAPPFGCHTITLIDMSTVTCGATSLSTKYYFPLLRDPKTNTYNRTTLYGSPSYGGYEHTDFLSQPPGTHAGILSVYRQTSLDAIFREALSAKDNPLFNNSLRYMARPEKDAELKTRLTTLADSLASIFYCLGVKYPPEQKVGEATNAPEKPKSLSDLCHKELAGLRMWEPTRIVTEFSHQDLKADLNGNKRKLKGTAFKNVQQFLNMPLGKLAEKVLHFIKGKPVADEPACNLLANLLNAFSAVEATEEAYKATPYPFLQLVRSIGHTWTFVQRTLPLPADNVAVARPKAVLDGVEKARLQTRSYLRGYLSDDANL